MSAAPAPYSREWWTALALNHVQARPEFQQDVVDRLMEHPGECLWHAVAVVTNRACHGACCRECPEAP